MSQISKQERAFVVEKIFGKKKLQYIAFQAAFQQRFNQTLPCKRTVQQNVNKYRSHRSSLNRNKENSGRRRSARSEYNIELVKNILKNNTNLTGICIKKYGRHVE